MTPSVDFAVVTALSIEREAVLRQLEDVALVQDDEHSLSYYRGRVTLPGGQAYNLIVVLLLGMGNNEAAIATTQLIARWHPASVIMLGIGAGVPGEVQLGDVVVADFAYYYELAKMTTGGEQRRGQQFPSDRLLFDRARAVRGREWTASIGLPRPDGQPIEAAPPAVCFGAIASGEKVVADDVTLARLRQECPKLLALAMEGAGVARAASAAYDRPRFIEIRGVSDFASPDKNDQWQTFAANAAAAFFVSWLRTRPTSPIFVDASAAPPPTPAAPPLRAAAPVAASDRSGDGRPRLIRTPDQRLRVFVSSTLQEVAEERKVAREAITKLRLAPVMFELGARPHPPKDLYRAYLEQSHVFIGIYWERYGWVAPDMNISGLEDEYRLSGDRPKLIYIKSPAPNREPRLKTLLDAIRDDDHASYKTFSTPDELRELIENDLMLLLSERFELSEIGAETPLRPVEPPLPPNNLPGQLSPFIGREAEVARIKTLLAASRLVTLTGSGGVGKTRLSLKVAADLLPQFQHGIWLVELATLTNPALVPQAVATVLGLREEAGPSWLAALTNYLREKQLLLLLDNCEHLIEACAHLAEELLTACHELRILASSREALGVSGEVPFHVPSMNVPAAERVPSPDELQKLDAVRLFVDRAVTAQPKFALTTQNAASVAQICRRLDGIPLAIELAAARVKVLSVEQIAARLDDRFRLLTGGSRTALPRQQTLRAMIDWSYALLSDPERRLFWRLAAFTGGWALEAAEAVCADDQLDVYDILDVMTRLVDKSLVIAEETAGTVRYRRLETIRQYASEKLRESNEETTMRARHFAYFAALADESEAHLIGGDQQQWLQRLDAEHDNFRGALTWAMQTDAAGALRLAGALGRFWDVRGYFTEGRSWLTQVLERNPAAPDRARALIWAGMLAARQGDYSRGIAQMQESVQLSRAANDDRQLVLGLNNLGYVLMLIGEFDQALPLLNEGLALSRALANDGYVAMALNHLGNVAWLQGDVVTARSQFEESLALRRRIDDRVGVGKSLYGLAALADAQGEYDQARIYLEESLAIAREVGDRRQAVYSLNGLGEVALAQGDIVAARQFHEEGLAAARELADKISIAYALEGLGFEACTQSDCPAARRYFIESIDLRREMGDTQGMLTCLEGLARTAIEANQQAEAARLLSAVENLRRQHNVLPLAAEQADFDRAVARTRANLDPAAFDAAWSAGRALTLDKAIAQAAAGLS